ncbi:hydrogenase maturation nickel metallochaperone HypA [Geomesophilobacter sediminis]|uniref:hydrogenase maturation nickel metallochaperone HypA n=1 Tax=Geomesophilobacter sediminis TaxID=2798584 RepID=UPI001F21E2AA|nr:hydrogenase maturation nickel metallochaperone HypA [Geomesophilobacter sediminis]
MVEFVAQAHGGTLRDEPLPNGGLQAACQGCGAGFVLETFVGSCPECGGVHAVSPPRCHDAANIQFAGAGFRLAE